MSRTDTATRIVPAEAPQAFAALTSKDALETWLPPTGMTGKIEDFDASVGGGYRMTLTLDDESLATGKTNATQDVVNVKYLEIVENEKIVQGGSFETEDPSFADGMTMTWTLEPTRRGTQVTVRADNVPDAIDQEDHITGLHSSLDNLARYLGE